MVFLLTITIVFLLVLAVVYYILPVLLQHRKLQNEYRNISLLPISSIPFVGNTVQINKEPPVFFRIICQLAKQCQDQGKGLFCLWYTLWPMLFLCSGQGLEVYVSGKIEI